MNLPLNTVDNTTGAGEPLNTGFDKVNAIIGYLNKWGGLNILAETRGDITGTVTEIPVYTLTTVLFNAGDIIHIIPANSSDTVEFEVSTDQQIGDDVIFVVSKPISGTIPQDSFVTKKTSTVVASRLTRDGVSIISESNAAGRLNQDVMGEVSELDVILFENLPSGTPINLPQTDPLVQFKIADGEESYGPGEVTIPLNIPVTFEASADEYLWVDGSFKATEINTTPGKIELKNVREQTENSIGTIAVRIAPGIPLSTINLQDIDGSIILKDNEEITIENSRGFIETIVVSGDQTLTAGTDTLTIDTKVFNASYEAGRAWVFEPGWSQSAKITVLSDEIDLRVEKDDVINAINISPEGILIDPSILNIDGTTVFGTGYTLANRPDIQRSSSTPTTRGDGSPLVNGDIWIVDSAFADGEIRYWDGAWNNAGTATENYADDVAESEATTARNNARDEIALRLGYSDYDDMVSESAGGNTVVVGGVINTELIIASSAFLTELLTVNATISGNIESDNFSAGSAGFRIEGTSGDAEFNDVTVRGVIITNSGSDIDGQYVQDLSISNAKIANGAITNAKIANATIESAKIVSLDADKVNAATLSAISADLGTITAGDITVGDNTWDSTGMNFTRGEINLTTSFGGTTYSEQTSIDSGGITVEDLSSNTTTITGLQITVSQLVSGGLRSQTSTLSIGQNDTIELNDGDIRMDSLPTSAPAESNRVWNDSGTLKIT